MRPDFFKITIHQSLQCVVHFEQCKTEGDEDQEIDTQLQNSRIKIDCGRQGYYE
jgi:hypothetical protein